MFTMIQEAPPLYPLRILHLEDSAIDHELVRHALNKSGDPCELVRVETLEEFELFPVIEVAEGENFERDCSSIDKPNRAEGATATTFTQKLDELITSINDRTC